MSTVKDASVPVASNLTIPSANETTVVVPVEPLIKVKPIDRWEAIGFRELWAHREIFYFLIWRDFKVRYKQTILGSSWVILQPLLMTLIFTIFLGRLVRVPAESVPYPVFVCAGLVCWTFFSNAVLSSSFSLIANAGLITKVYFPRLLVPSAAVMVRVIDFVIASLILLVMLIYYGLTPTKTLLLFPLFIVQLTLLALGVGLVSAVLNIRYRDVGTLLPFLLQLWMFVSPVVYPSGLVPQKWRPLYHLNPLVGILEGSRASLLGLRFNWSSIGISAIVTLFLLGYSIYCFRRAEQHFADIV